MFDDIQSVERVAFIKFCSTHPDFLAFHNKMQEGDEYRAETMIKRCVEMGATEHLFLLWKEFQMKRLSGDA